MTSEPDDEALTWDGDDENRTRPPRGRRPLGRGGEAVSADRSELASDSAVDDADGTDAAAVRPSDGETSDGEPQPIGTVGLVLVGVLGGVYLLYTVGWLIGGLRLKPLANLIVADAMYLPWLVLAVAAPALWFLVSWVLTRGRAAGLRMLLLAAGVVLLIPWPFVMMGVVGS